MANIQQTIQRELFQQSDERLKYVIAVVKPHKKKNKTFYFLAIVVNNVKNSHFLCLIKKTDQNFRKDKMWSFDDIQQIDAKYESIEPEFEIFLSNKQSLRWIAAYKTDKLPFLQSMQQIISQNSEKMNIKFTNLVKGANRQTLSDNNSEIFNTGNSEKLDNGEWNQNDDSYQALTSREEADLERLLELEVENTINNAEAFTEKLSRDLSSMDSLNIQDIMASEQRVLDLMENLKNSIDETFRLENKIIYYESLLKNVRDIVQRVEKKEAIFQIYNDNNKRLLDELSLLVTKLDFCKEYENVLMECDLNSMMNFSKCLEAALKLQEAIQYEVPSALLSLKAVSDQKNYLQDVASRFSFNLVNQLKKIITDLSNDSQEKLYSLKGQESVLSEHTFVHNNLLRYAPFIKWIRSIDSKSYSYILTFYMNSFGVIYDNEFLYFFEYLRERYVYTSSSKGVNSSFVLPSPSEIKRKSLGVADLRSDYRRSSYTPSTNTDTVETASTRSSEISLSEWEEFDSYIEFLLKSIDPVCLAEQQFCNKFFDFENQTNSSMPSTPVFNKNTSNSETDVSISNHSSNFSEQSNQSKKNDQLRNILAELFKSLENEFINFSLHYDKIDGIYSLYFLVRLTNHVLSAQDTGSFLSKAYGNILIHIKRNFDRYMLAQQSEIEEAKDPKKNKVGVLSFIKRFETFARQTENILKYGNQRRSDIDRWYIILMGKIFQSISRIAKEHQKLYKTPSQMIELENYHYLQIMLSSLKISCLENEKKVAKASYNNALKEYVNLYFRRPLEKLNIFFEGVQQKVQQGVREEEIGYQLAFSKQELRKVIKDCNLKDIKKGLEEMYRRVEKHVSDPESTLIQVIWRSMQEEFITQYKSIQEMIKRCYPQAKINLLFSIDDVLNIFSEIAQTH